MWGGDVGRITCVFIFSSSFVMFELMILALFINSFVSDMLNIPLKAFLQYCCSEWI